MVTLKKTTIFYVLLFLLCSVLEVVAELSPEEKAAMLQEAYDQTSSFTADFTQTTSMKLSRRQRKGLGSLVIKKPGLMRWDYQEPDHQVLVCDGEEMSMYFSSAKQMIVMSAQEYLQSDVTYAFFAGNGNVLRDFNVGSIPDDYCCGDLPDLKLVPKKQHPQVENIYLWLDERFLISRMKISDHYGSVTELTFTNIKLNQPVTVDRFNFVPPPGTEIVKQ